MMSIVPNKQQREKETEIFRNYLEKSGTIDALTGWIRKAIETPAEERPTDPKNFLRKNWNQWNGNVLQTAVRNALQQTHGELVEVLKENEALNECIGRFEAVALRRRLSALEASVAALKNRASKS